VGERVKKVQYHWELEVYRMSVEAAMLIFELSKKFPKEEIYSLTDQIRRSSRSVSSAIAEGWRRRKYQNALVNKLNESESEAAETLSHFHKRREVITCLIFLQREAS